VKSHKVRQSKLERDFWEEFFQIDLKGSAGVPERSKGQDLSKQKLAKVSGQRRVLRNPVA